MKHGRQTGHIALNATLASNSMEYLEISNIYAEFKHGHIYFYRISVQCLGSIKFLYIIII